MMDPICWAIAFSGWVVSSLLMFRVMVVSKQMEKLRLEFDSATQKSIILIDRATAETKAAADAHREANEAIARARYALEHIK